MKNKLFDVVHVVANVIVPGTNYTLEESGLVNEIAIAGDELNIAKVKLLASDDNSGNWENLDEEIRKALYALEGIDIVKVKHRIDSPMGHCPQEIRQMF